VTIAAHSTTVQATTDSAGLTLWMWTCTCGARGMPNANEYGARQGARGHEQKSGRSSKPQD
jgi:hypothetical protein